ncbi:MAG: hypothetical protein C0501_17125 [Isosphaera sp.]|nr:hypothetical protein [Isosphaera sp.]
MIEFAARLFDTSGFVPRAECGQWTPGLVGLHLVSDFLIWVAYVSIPIVLLAFARRRDLPYPRLFILFAAFILACGTVHLVEAVIFFRPVYRLSGVVKAVTAVVSLWTVAALIPVVRRLFAVEQGKLMAALDQIRGGGFGERGVSGWVTVAWGVAAVGVVTSVAVSSYHTNALIHNDARETRTREVKAEVSGLLSDLKDLETGYRGFQITGREDFLDPYHRAAESVRDRLAKLDGLLADDPEQAADYAELKGLAARKFDDVTRGIEVHRRDGKEAGQAEVLKATGKAIMDDARAAAARVDGREDARLTGQREAARDTFAATTANNLVGGGLALGMLLLGYGLIRWEFGRRLKAETALSLREEELRVITDAVPALISYVGADGRYRFVNRQYEVWFGTPREQVVGRHLREVVGDETYAALRPNVERVLAGERFEFETFAPYKDGGGRHVHVDYVPRFDGGRVVGYFALVADMSERKRAEEALRRSEATLRAFYDSSPLCMGVVEPLPGDVRHVYDNRASCRFFGVEPEQTAGKRATELGTPPEVLARWLGKYRDSAARGGPVRFEYDYPGADGRRWLSATVAPLDAAADRFCYLAEDVTDRKRAEEAVRESEERLRAVFDQATAGVAETDLTGRFVRVNARYAEIVGRPAADLYALRMQDLTHPDDLPGNARRFAALVAGTGPPFVVEKRYLRPDGSAVWVSNSVSLVRDAAGAPRTVVAVSQDVTARRRAEEELRESERRFRETADAAPAMLWVTDPAGACTFLSRGWYEYTGQTEADALGLGWTDATHPADRAEAGRVVLAANARREEFRFEYRLRGPGGAYRWALDAGRPRYSPAGEYLGMVGVVIEIDDRKRAEEALRANEERYRTLTEAIPQVVWNAGPDGGVTYLNRRWREYTGLQFDRAAGRGWLAAVHPADRDGVLADWQETADQAAAGSADRFSRELRLRRAGTDEHRWFLTVAVPLRHPDGSVDQWIGSMADIHDQRTAAERVAESERFLAATINALTKHLAVLDEAGTILRVNEAWRRFGEANGLAGGAGAVGTDYLAACEVPCPGGDGASFSDAIRAVIRGDRQTFAVDYPCHSPAERRWFQMRVSRFPGVGPVRVVVTHDDITARVLAEEATRESEAKFRFLDALGQATREADPGEVMAVTARMLGEHLGATRCAYAEVDPDADRFHIRHDWTDGAATTVGAHSLDAFGPRAAADMRAGRVLVVRDVGRELAPAGGAGAFAAIGIGAIVCCPLVKGGRLTAMMAVHQAGPRDWTAAEVGLVREVCERSWAHIELQRSEAAAAETEDKFRLMTDSIPQLAWMAHGDGHIFWYNRRWYEYTGSTPAEMEGWGWEKVHDPAVLPAVNERWRASLETGEPFDMTFPLKGADGRFRPFLTRVVPTRGASGKVVRWFGTNTDVTDQRELEQALRDAAGRFRTLTEAVPQLVWTADPRGEPTFFNRRWHEHTGLPLTPGEAEHWISAVHPDDIDRFRAEWQLAVAGRPDRFTSEFRLRRAADGAYRWMLSTAVPLRDEAGAVAEWVGSITDIDDQKRYAEVLEDVVRKRTAALAEEVEERTRAEAEVREQRGFLDAILANVADGIVACDAAGTLTLFNQACREFHGLPAEPLPPDRWADRYSLLRAGGGAPLAPDEIPLARALAGERVRDFEFVIAPAGLPRRTVLASGQPLVADDGRQLGAVVSMRDVTAMKEAERKLKEANAELVRSNAELEQFAYVASHDLQEPLRKIQAFGDRLTTKFRAAVPDGAKEYVDRMQTSAGRMQRLINDLLNYSRVTTTARPFSRLNLTRLVREVVSDLSVRIEATGADVRVGELPDIEADPTQMRQLFQNLIANAVKFHRPGVPPVVEVSGAWVIDPPPAGPAADPAPVCRIAVRDNGIGFDEKYLDRIFQVFQRLHGRDEYDGTGVGLAVCRKIAERHGGSITAHSRPGDGATFVVTLPARQVPPPLTPPPGTG